MTFLFSKPHQSYLGGTSLMVRVRVIRASFGVLPNRTYLQEMSEVQDVEYCIP